MVYDIPIANNLATADFLLASSFMEKEYDRHVEDYQRTLRKRVDAFLT